MGDSNVGKRPSRFWSSLTREQKLTVGVLVVCGLVALMLAYVQLRRDLIFPFTTTVEEYAAFKKMFGPSEEELVLQAQRTDTDGDGISDWHEENVYRTSAYLRDTDSDGEPDNIEIAKGTDPNCPKGEVCYTPFSSGAASTGTSNVLQSVTPEAASVQAYGDVLQMVPERDPDAIRAFLRAQGVSDLELANYTDEQLLEAFDQSTASFEGTAEEGVPVPESEVIPETESEPSL